MKTSLNLIISIVILGIFDFFALTCNQTHQKHNELTDKELKEGWVSLFDGQTINEWRGYNKDAFPSEGWTVEEGTLRCIGSDRGEAGSGGDIITKKKYSNFELRLDWKIEKAGNSGVMYLVTELPGKPAWHSGPEMQILDGANFPMELEPAQLSGSAYDLVPANPQNVKPYGEWNSIKIIVNNGKVEHWQNNELVAGYELWTPEWKAMVMDSKFNKYPEFINMSKEGHICLQDHGSNVWFRNISIREL